jgi:hypothetical protein
MPAIWMVIALYGRTAGKRSRFLISDPPDRMKHALALGLLFGCFYVGSGVSQTQVSDVGVVVNSSNAVSNVSFDELRKIFAGEKRSWTGGVRIQLLVRSPRTRERQVLLKLLQMNEDDYKQYWRSQVYRGEVEAEPMVLPSLGMVKEALKVFPGAIALVDSREIKPDMKVMKVDGHLPGENGYPLR